MACNRRKAPINQPVDFRRGELQLARRRRRHVPTRVDALRACALAGAGELELAPTKSTGRSIGASQKGESITEVLVATAIGGLALLMLAMAVSAAVHMAASSRDSLNDYYDASNAIAEADAEPDGSGEVTLVLAADGGEVSLAGDDLRVRYYRFESDAAGLGSVIAYEAYDAASEAGGA